MTMTMEAPRPETSAREDEDARKVAFKKRYAREVRADVYDMFGDLEAQLDEEVPSHEPVTLIITPESICVRFVNMSKVRYDLTVGAPEAEWLMELYRDEAAMLVKRYHDRTMTVGNTFIMERVSKRGDDGEVVDELMAMLLVTARFEL